MHMRLKKFFPVVVLLGIGLLVLYFIAPEIGAVTNAIHCTGNMKIMFWSVRPSLILSSGHTETTCADGSGTIYSPVPPELESASQVRFSPDGERVAFVSLTRHDYKDHIFVMNSDGSQLVRLSNTYGYESDPAWSPDGRRLAFYGYITGSPDEGIFVVEIACLDTKTDCASTAKFLGRGSAPAFSSDGRRIAFELRDGLSTRIYTMDADGSNRVNLTNNDHNDFSPTWSPDGQLIAFESLRDPPGIYLIKADGSAVTYLRSGSQPVWSPDGRHIALISVLDTDSRIPVLEANIPANALFLISVDGMETVRLTHYSPEHITTFAWIP